MDRAGSEREGDSDIVADLLELGDCEIDAELLRECTGVFAELLTDSCCEIVPRVRVGEDVAERLRDSDASVDSDVVGSLEIVS